jgi:hypothetical protein
MALTHSEFLFYRSEIRTLHNTHKGNIEGFLNDVAIMVGNLTVERDKLQTKLDESEQQLRVLNENC